MLDHNAPSFLQSPCKWSQVFLLAGKEETELSVADFSLAVGEDHLTVLFFLGDRGYAGSQWPLATWSEAEVKSVFSAQLCSVRATGMRTKHVTHTHIYFQLGEPSTEMLLKAHPCAHQLALIA